MAAAVVVTAAACGSSGSRAAAPGGDSVGGGSPGQVQLDEKANGTTVHVHFGDTVVVTLHSTYWSFLPTGQSLALQLFAPVATAPAGNCRPGVGCGTVTATYNVGHVGTTVLRAHRDSCGEALRCIGTQGDWSVTVVAT